MLDSLFQNAEVARLQMIKQKISGLSLMRFSYATANGFSVRNVMDIPEKAAQRIGVDTIFGRVVSVEQVGF